MSRRLDASSLQPARRRPSTWIAVGLLILVIGMLAFLLASEFILPDQRVPNPPGTNADVLAAITYMSAFLPLPAVGAILAIRRASNPIGWLLLVSGASFILGEVGYQYVQRSVTLGSELPGDGVADWLAGPAQSLAFILLLVWTPLLFPDGHLPGPRWRPVAWAAAIAMVAALVADAGTVKTDWRRLTPNPFAFDGPVADLAVFLLDASRLILIGLSVLAAVSVIVRFRRSRGIAREQLKWFLAAIGVLVVAGIATMVTRSDLAYLMMIGSLAFVPVAIGIAVLRYRLYEIDRLISRTIGYALVTGVLVLVFIGGVLALQTTLEPLTGGNTVAVAASTLIVAALFQPLRRRIQGAVDRRFDRARYDGQKVVDGFGRQLRDEVDLDRLRTTLLATTEDVIRPVSASIWLRSGEAIR